MLALLKTAEEIFCVMSLMYFFVSFQVTPKSPGLNPNASVFSCKSATGVPDTGQWERSDSGINSSSGE